MSDDFLLADGIVCLCQANEGNWKCVYTPSSVVSSQTFSFPSFTSTSKLSPTLSVSQLKQLLPFMLRKLKHPVLAGILWQA